MHSQEFVSRMKERLVEEKERLVEELKDFSQHNDIGSDAPDDKASESELDEVNEDIAETLRADLKKVEAALVKIDAGTYGMTDDGQMIPEDRLEVIPWADTLAQ
jgi:DnaK suppressor protein